MPGALGRVYRQRGQGKKGRWSDLLSTSRMAPREELSKPLRCPSRLPYPEAPSWPPLCLGPYLWNSQAEYRPALDRDQGVRLLSGRQQEVVETKESFNENLWEGGKQARRMGRNKGRLHSESTARLWSQNRLTEHCHGTPDGVFPQAHLYY